MAIHTSYAKPNRTAIVKICCHLAVPGKYLLGWGFLLVVLVFPPGPVHADVGVVLRLPGDGVAVAEQELLVGIVLEVVVAAHVDHGGGLRLRRGKAFAAVGEDLRAQLQPLAELLLHSQPV